MWGELFGVGFGGELFGVGHPGWAFLHKQKFFRFPLKQEVYFLDKPSFYAGEAPAGAFFAAQVPKH